MAGKQGRKKGGSSTGRLLRRGGSTVSGSKKAAAVPTCKYYMSEDSVQAVLNHKYEPVDLGEHFDKMDPEDQRMMLEVAAQHEEVEKRYAVYQARVREEYNSKGFVALPDDVLEKTAALNAYSSKVFYGECAAAQ